MTKRETLGSILQAGLVPLVLADDLPVLECLAQMVSFGLEAVEISIRHPQVLSLIGQAKSRFPQMAIGACGLMEDGRLRDFLNASGPPLPSIAQCVDAGADFLVSMLPFTESTYERYRDTLVIVPGVFTAGEGHRALELGANLLKFVNPQLLDGPDLFRALDETTYHAFPHFITAPMKCHHAGGYIAAGALAIEAGFDLLLGPDYRPMQRAFDEDLVRERLEPWVHDIERARRHYQGEVPFSSRDPEAIAKASGRLLNP